MLDVFLFPISLGLWGVRISLHGLGSWFPLGWANFSVLVGMLESLNKSHEFINISSNWKVIVRGVSEDSLIINDESGSTLIILLPVSNSCVWSLGHEAAIDSRDDLSDVCNQWNLDISETSLVSWKIAPLEVTELRIDGSTHQSAVESIKFLLCISKSQNLSWADKGEIKRVEEDANPLSGVVIELDILEFLFLIDSGFEVRSWFSNDSSWINFTLVDPSEFTGDSAFAQICPLLVFLSLIHLSNLSKFDRWG